MRLQPEKMDLVPGLQTLCPCCFAWFRAILLQLLLRKVLAWHWGCCRSWTVVTSILAVPLVVDRFDCRRQRTAHDMCLRTSDSYQYRRRTSRWKVALQLRQIWIERGSRQSRCWTHSSMSSRRNRIQPGNFKILVFWKSHSYLQLGDPFNSLERTQHSEHSQRFDGVQVFTSTSLGTPANKTLLFEILLSNDNSKKLSSSRRHTKTCCAKWE